MLHEIIADPEFWVAIAFIIAVGGLIYKGGPGITAALDQRALKIKTELDEAQRLREDAQRTLADYQRKQRDALREAEQIVAQARAEAERAAEQAERDLAASLERRQRLALEKIALAESRATAEVRNAAVDVAITAVRRILAETLDQTQRSTILNRAVSELSLFFH